MSKKKDRIQKRRIALEILVEEQGLWCEKHEDYVTSRMIRNRRCYLTRRKGYAQCPYLKFIKNYSDEGCRK